ncbi:MAG: aldehyde dehydrogenase family protein [Polaromonas sp.]|nr:aldehyde dehydrogenase family protein [Polaromonas sp.]
MNALLSVAAPRLPSAKTLIDGKWLDGESLIPVLQKFDNSTICQLHQASRAQVAQAVNVTHAASQRQSWVPLDRARVLRKTAELIERNSERFVSVMVHEAGFTASDAQGEVDRSLVTLRLCAEESTRLVGQAVSFAGSAGQHQRLGFTLRMPLGVVCAITPFNSPLNTVIHKIGPAIAGGNSVVLKPSALAPLSSALLCETLLEAGLPPDMLALVHGGESVGQALLDEPAIAFYTFTGSTRVGRAIQAGAGLRKTQLELGSIASVIVCADADLKRAAAKIANASFRKAGQVCTSVQRLYVEASVAAELAGLLKAAALEMPAGDPRLHTTRVGPLISEDAARRVEGWVREACDAGAEVVTGGERQGSVISPTILEGVSREMKVVDQEVFGPLVSILPFGTIEQALAGANDSPYGLAAGIFTRNIDSALAAARQLRFGAVHINETSSSRADAMPFGGVKASGFGQEGPAYAIREVTEERLITFTP